MILIAMTNRFQNINITTKAINEVMKFECSIAYNAERLSVVCHRRKIL